MAQRFIKLFNLYIIPLEYKPNLNDLNSPFKTH